MNYSVWPLPVVSRKALKNDGAGCRAKRTVRQCLFNAFLNNGQVLLHTARKMKTLSVSSH